MKPKISPWLIIPAPLESPVARLFCFPYAGGSAVIYRDWATALADGIELVIIQLPGRANRLFEEPCKKISDVLDGLLSEIIPLLDKPYFVIGHSLGGRIALDLVSELTLRGVRLPDLFIASGSRAPQQPLRKPSIADLPYAEFINELRLMGGTPKEVLDNDEMMELFLPMLRADFAMASELREVHDLINSNLVIFWGDEDEFVTESDVMPWAEFFTGNSSVYCFNGGHFFIETQRASVIQKINELLTNQYSLIRYVIE